jgi:hypothetical protein
MTAYVLPPTTDVRKAIAFVEALAALERDYGYLLQVGEAEYVGDGTDEPVLFGNSEAEGDYIVVRSGANPGDLRLALPT